MVFINVANDIHEISHSFFPVDLVLRQQAHLILEVVPLRDCNAQNLLYHIRLEERVVWNLERTRCAIDGYGQGVIAHHTHGSSSPLLRVKPSVLCEVLPAGL